MELCWCVLEQFGVDVSVPRNRVYMVDCLLNIDVGLVQPRIDAFNNAAFALGVGAFHVCVLVLRSPN